MGISTWAEVFDMLAKETAVGGLLHGAKVGLYQTAVTITRDTKLSDLTAATFTGYAPVAIATWSAPFIDSDGVAKIDGGDVVFQPTDAVTPNTVYGWFLVDSGGTILLYAQPFPAPIPLPTALQAATADVVVAYGD